MSVGKSMYRASWLLLLWGLAAPVQALDLVQAYEQALAQDATLRAARATADASMEKLPQAQAQLLPNISASLTRNSNRLSSTAPDASGQLQTSDTSYPSRNDTLSIRQPIYRKYQWAQYQQARHQIDDAQGVLATEVQNLAVRVATAYFEVLLAQEHLTFIQAQATAYTAQLEGARKLLAGGSGTRTDIDDAQAKLDMTRAQALEAEQNLDYTRRQLQVLLNQPVQALAPLDVARLPLLPPQPQQLDDWLRLAEEKSPEIQSLQARLAAARLEVDKARAGHFPTLDAVAQWSRSASENMLSVTSSYGVSSLGVQLTVPLYAGGGVASAERQALASARAAEEQLEATRRDLGVRVHKEYRGVMEGMARVRALEQALRSAEQALLSSQKSLLAGARTRVDVLNAESSKTQVQRDLSQARYVYLLSGLRLKALAAQADLSSMQDLNRWLDLRP